MGRRTSKRPRAGAVYEGVDGLRWAVTAADDAGVHVIHPETGDATLIPWPEWRDTEGLVLVGADDAEQKVG